MNAFTTKEYTAFYIRLLAEDLDARPRHPLRHHEGPGAAARRRRRRAPGDPGRDPDARRRAGRPVARALRRGALPGHPLGREVLGHRRDVDRHRPAADIRAFFEHHYRPGNIVVAAAGDCRPRRRSPPASSGASPAARAARAPSAQRPGGAAEPLRRASTRPTEQAHLVARACARSRRFDDGPLARWPCSTTCSAAGCPAGCSRRSASSGAWPTRSGPSALAYDDAGSLAVVRRHRARARPRGARARRRRARDLADDGVTERELAVAKGNLRADTLLACEDSGRPDEPDRRRPAAARRGAHGRRDPGPHRGASTADDVSEAARAAGRAPVAWRRSAPSTPTPSTGGAWPGRHAA